MGIRKTVAEIISDAALQLGLVDADIADPYASGTDAAIVQLTAFLKAEGRKLARKFHWNGLRRTYTFPTINLQPAYAVPADFGFLITGTVWDRTRKEQFGNPLGPQEWEALASGAVTGVAGQTFRISGDEFSIFPAPDATVRTIAYEYQSTGWLYDDLGDDPATSDPAGKDATPSFDADLMVCAIKLAWLRAKGQPSDAAAEDYREALAEAQGNDGSKPVLRIGAVIDISLDGCNIPETGYGL